MIETLARKVSMGELPPNTRITRAVEEYQLWDESRGEDPRKSDYLREYFDEQSYPSVWIPTSTVLRVPKGWENNREDKMTRRFPKEIIETDTKQASNLLQSGATWQEIGDSLNKIVGETQVPVGVFFVVEQVDDVFGIPMKVNGHEHAYRRPTLHMFGGLSISTGNLDVISGHIDDSICYASHVLDIGHPNCLYIMLVPRTNPNPKAFRPARGSMPIIKRYSLKQV